MALIGVLRGVSWRTAVRLGRVLGSAFRPLFARKNGRICESLALAGLEDLEARSSRVWEHAGMTFFEMLWMLSRGPERIRPHMTVEGLEAFARAREGGRGALLVSAHAGNWETVPLAATLSGMRVAVVARAMRTPALERRMIHFRQRCGVRTLLRGEPGVSVTAARWLPRGGILGCMMDRSSAGRRLLVPMLGRGTHVPLGPAELACRASAEVIQGSAWRGEDARIVVTFRRLETHGTRDPIELATLIGKALDEQIRMAPEQWFWIYRRQPGWAGSYEVLS